MDELETLPKYCNAIHIMEEIKVLLKIWTMFCKRMYRKKKNLTASFSNNFTHLQIIIQKKKIHFIKILPLVLKSLWLLDCAVRTK